MTALSAGDKAPDFTLPTGDGGSVSLAALRGRIAVVYFYPKDDTPGCTKEACAFRDAMGALEKEGAAVIGISKDSPARHAAFTAKYDLNFPLASDEDGAVCEAYGVWIEKSMYGRRYMGIDRATFVIGPDGTIAQLWRKVKVPGHADEVMKVVRSCKKAA